MLIDLGLGPFSECVDPDCVGAEVPRVGASILGGLPSCSMSADRAESAIFATVFFFF